VVSIHVVTEDDWSAWRGLRLAALHDSPAAFGSTYDDWKDATESRWRQRLRGPNALNLVAEHDGSMIGMASGVPGDRPHTIELISMWVEPAARGTGVADTLIAAIEKWAAMRAEELWLAVVPTNERAIAFYARYGFTPVDAPGDPLRDGSGHEVLMKKGLGLLN
jgi:ribosomal protein S18 acetylase RimI-like enzyme